MQASDLRLKSVEDLNKQMLELQNELESVGISVLENKEKNTSKIRKTRQNLARIKTVLNEKKIISQMEVN